MIDFSELMAIFSQPRPNGSRAERETVDSVCSWLDARAIPYRLQAFRRYPYFFECIGVWLVISRLSLAAALWLDRGWIALLLALMGLAGGLVDMIWVIPLVTWPGGGTGKNLLVEFQPAAPRREVVLSAHYDSKTEPLDHRRRMMLLRLIPLGIFLTAITGILAALSQVPVIKDIHAGAILYWIDAGLSIPLLIISLGLGLNLSTGRLLQPSQGAVDNGAACAILLGLAERLNDRSGLTAEIENLLDEARITIALFAAEEANMQGSQAFIRFRMDKLPQSVFNLEVMAQDGDYVYWQSDGTVFHQLPSDGRLNDLLIAAVRQVTGKPPLPSGPLTSDGGSFLAAGIPATTLGTKDRAQGWSGFHSSRDNLERVCASRLDEGVEILLQLLTGLQNAGYINRKMR